jgi:hypothetical protein
MAKPKKAEVSDDTVNTSPIQDPQAEQGAAAAPAEGEAPQGPPKNKWISRFGSWGDYEAGVRLIEDRQNKLMTIKFAEKPSEEVRQLLKSEEHGFQFDPEEKVWYKKISPARPGQSRQEAEELAHTAANMIRQEKGLEQKSFSPSF